MISLPPPGLEPILSTIGMLAAALLFGGGCFLVATSFSGRRRG